MNCLTKKKAVFSCENSEMLIKVELTLPPCYWFSFVLFKGNKNIPSTPLWALNSGALCSGADISLNSHLYSQWTPDLSELSALILPSFEARDLPKYGREFCKQPGFYLFFLFHLL